MNTWPNSHYEINRDFSNDFLKRNFRSYDANSKQLQVNTIKVSSNVYKTIQNPTVDFIEHYRNIYSTPENFIKRRVDYGRMKVMDEKFRKESERLKSLHSFPKDLDNLVKPIARSGFYSIANKDEPDKVKCIFCQGILFSWKKSDNPEREHKKSFPTCPFLLNLNVGNEPLIEQVEKTLKIDPDLEDIEEKEIPYQIVRPYENFILYELDLDMDWREETFLLFDHLKHLSLQGLFIDKQDGLIFLKCHKCFKQIELLNDVGKLPATIFHQLDCYYHPITKETSKNCKELEISKVKTDNVESTNFCIVEYSITNDEIEARLDSRIANQIEKLQFNREEVKEVIATKLKSTGKDYESTFELLVDLKANVKQERVKANSNNFELALLNYVCVVCLDRPVEVVFLPCGHFKTCKACSNVLSNCPVCRHIIEKRVWGIRFGDSYKK